MLQLKINNLFHRGAAATQSAQSASSHTQPYIPNPAVPKYALHLKTKVAALVDSKAWLKKTDNNTAAYNAMQQTGENKEFISSYDVAKKYTNGDSSNRIKAQRVVYDRVKKAMEQSKKGATQKQINDDMFVLAQLGGYTGKPINIYNIAQGHTNPYLMSITVALQKLEEQHNLLADKKTFRQIAGLMAKQESQEFADVVKLVTQNKLDLNNQIKALIGHSIINNNPRHKLSKKIAGGAALFLVGGGVAGAIAGHHGIEESIAQDGLKKFAHDHDTNVGDLRFGYLDTNPAYKDIADNFVGQRPGNVYGDVQDVYLQEGTGKKFIVDVATSNGDREAVFVDKNTGKIFTNHRVGNDIQTGTTQWELVEIGSDRQPKVGGAKIAYTTQDTDNNMVPESSTLPANFTQSGVEVDEKGNIIPNGQQASGVDQGNGFKIVNVDQRTGKMYTIIGNSGLQGGAIQEVDAYGNKVGQPISGQSARTDIDQNPLTRDRSDMHNELYNQNGELVGILENKISIQSNSASMAIAALGGLLGGGLYQTVRRNIAYKSLSRSFTNI